jgi:hypothetical protein
MTQRSSFRYFKTSTKIIRLAAMLYVRFPLPQRNVEDLLHERGIDISHESVQFWWNRIGPIFAADFVNLFLLRFIVRLWGTGPPFEPLSTSGPPLPSVDPSADNSASIVEASKL